MLDRCSLRCTAAMSRPDNNMWSHGQRPPSRGTTRDFGHEECVRQERLAEQVQRLLAAPSPDASEPPAGTAVPLGPASLPAAHGGVGKGQTGGKSNHAHGPAQPAQISSTAHGADLSWHAPAGFSQGRVSASRDANNYWRLQTAPSGQLDMSLFGAPIPTDMQPPASGAGCCSCPDRGNAWLS